MDFPHILHYCAVSGVTGSCHQLLMGAANNLLVDCCLFQGAKISPDGKAGVGRLAIDFPVDGIKALVATHVYIDHVGCIPYLLATGFKGLIILDSRLASHFTQVYWEQDAFLNAEALPRLKKLPHRCTSQLYNCRQPPGQLGHVQLADANRSVSHPHRRQWHVLLRPHRQRHQGHTGSEMMFFSSVTKPKALWQVDSAFLPA